MDIIRHYMLHQPAPTARAFGTLLLQKTTLGG